jgi:cytochrome b pre-mRNA-processing protein 3
MLGKFFESLFDLKGRPMAIVGRALYASCASQGRQPEFYTHLFVKDVIGARFEMLTLHVSLILDALKSETNETREAAKEAAQAVFDAMLQGLEDALRVQGVGDLSIPKKMKKLTETIYSRLKGYNTAQTQDELTAYLLKTVYADYEDESLAPKEASKLSGYVLSARAELKATDLLANKVSWPMIGVESRAEV